MAFVAFTDHSGDFLEGKESLTKLSKMELKRQPTIYQTVALPTELLGLIPFTTNTYVNSCVSVHTVGSGCQYTTKASMWTKSVAGVGRQKDL
ncbi:MAG: hypothetical protein EBW38_10115 [Rhodobacteraceae bacterium]|nr:hypothetical protein [Paracoccaceae bacterium]